MKRRRNDGPWRRECLARRGAFCRSCGATNDLQVDHIIPRGHGGASVVENGLVLCGPWSNVTPGGCHALKTAHRMTIDYSWLDEDQTAYLADQGWVEWDDVGEPRGRGYRDFTPTAPKGTEDGQREEERPR